MQPDANCLLFPSNLGWIGVKLQEQRIQQLIFGFSSREKAIQALGPDQRENYTSAKHPLIARLQRYAEGMPDDFLDLDVEYAPPTRFARRTLEACRKIPLGDTISYAELASRAGSPGAARAAGQVMANNRIPLIIPCHRVVGSGGRLGGYSAPGGIATKQRLLELEAASRLIALVQS